MSIEVLNPTYLVLAGEDDKAFKMETLEVAVTTAIRQSRLHSEARIINKRMELVAAYRDGQEVI